jgi:hypothetical protein
VEAYFLDGVHAACSEDVLESEGFAGGDFSNDVDDPNDSESDGDDEDGDDDTTYLQYVLSTFSHRQTDHTYSHYHSCIDEQHHNDKDS